MERKKFIFWRTHLSFPGFANNIQRKVFVCTNGQLRFSAFCIIRSIIQNIGFVLFWWSWSRRVIDRSKLKLRYKERLTLWNYSIDLYEQNLSDVTLNERRLKQLDQIFIEELQEIKKLNPDYIQGYLFGKPAPERWVL